MSFAAKTPAASQSSCNANAAWASLNDINAIYTAILFFLHKFVFQYKIAFNGKSLDIKLNK